MPSKSKDTMNGKPEDINVDLRNACIEGDLVKVKDLVSKGADINQQNQHKNTSLTLATLYGHKDVVDFLLDKKAKTDVTNMNGQTPLQIACIKGFLSIVREFTKRKCDLHIRTGFSEMTALHFASKEGHAEICQHLLDCGASEDIEDAVDNIAEYYAANEPTEEVFRKRKPKKEEPPPKTPPPPKQKTPTPPLKERTPTPPPPKQRTPTPPPKERTPTPPPPTPSPSPPPKVDTPPPPKPETPTSKPESPPPRRKSPTPAKPPTTQRESKPREKQTYAHETRDPKKIPKHGLNYNFRDAKSEYGQLKKHGVADPLKNHDFEWSEGFKERQQKSVFDRLMGGGKKKGAAAEQPKEPEKGKGAKPKK